MKGVRVPAEEDSPLEDVTACVRGMFYSGASSPFYRERFMVSLNGPLTSGKVNLFRHLAEGKGELEVLRALGAGKQRCALGCSPQLSPESSYAPPSLPREVLGKKDACIAGSHRPSHMHAHSGVPGFSLGSPGVKVVPLLLQKIQLSPLEPLHSPPCAWKGPRQVGQAFPRRRQADVTVTLVPAPGKCAGDKLPHW